MILYLKQRHLDLLKEESRKAQPVEACAMLFGNVTNEEIVVRKVVLALNKLHSTERFEIDPETAFEAITEAEKEGMDFVGLFHSHPAPAVPSTIDLRVMKLWGDSIWLIMSLSDDTLAAYQMKSTELREITIVVK